VKVETLKERGKSGITAAEKKHLGVNRTMRAARPHKESKYCEGTGKKKKKKTLF